MSWVRRTSARSSRRIPKRGLVHGRRTPTRHMMRPRPAQGARRTFEHRVRCSGTPTCSSLAKAAEARAHDGPTARVSAQRGPWRKPCIALGSHRSVGLRATSIRHLARRDPRPHTVVILPHALDPLPVAAYRRGSGVHRRVGLPSVPTPFAIPHLTVRSRSPCRTTKHSSPCLNAASRATVRGRRSHGSGQGRPR